MLHVLKLMFKTIKCMSRKNAHHLSIPALDKLTYFIHHPIPLWAVPHLWKELRHLSE